MKYSEPAAFCDLDRSTSLSYKHKPPHPALDSCGNIKWGSVTHRFPERPGRFDDAGLRLRSMDHDPRAHDVMIAQVKLVGRHKGIELDCGRKAEINEGDLVGLAFGYRYATRQFVGEVPALQPEYHMLSQGGVCGQVASAPSDFVEPTVVLPIGYLADRHGQTVNLRQYSLPPLAVSQRVPVIVVVGSAMDAGKTTTAANLIRGLARGGMRVHGGKLSGTGCLRDLMKMKDAGASQVIDFTSAGFVSTANATPQELAHITDVLISQLSQDSPDYLVIEIADGLVQRETRMLMEYLTGHQLFEHLVLAVHDAMAAPTCIAMLEREWQARPSAISGTATISPQSTLELSRLVDFPCLGSEDLRTPTIARSFFGNSRESPGNDGPE